MIRAIVLIENFEDSYNYVCPFAELIEDMLIQLCISNGIEAEEAEKMIVEAREVAITIVKENKR